VGDGSPILYAGKLSRRGGTLRTATIAERSIIKVRCTVWLVGGNIPGRTPYTIGETTNEERAIMKSTFLFLCASAVVGLVLLLPGCSPTGWATREVPTGSNLTPGENVTVVENDGISVTGTFVGLESIPMAEYIDLYSNAVHPTLDGKLLPAVGQNIMVSTSVADEKVWEAQFLGFDYKSLWVRLKGQTQPQELYISTINNITGRNGERFQRMTIRNLYLDGSIPLMSAVVLKSTRGDLRIPVNSIKGLTTESSAAGGQANGLSMDGASLRSSLMR
jgi:hypothetical protein